MVEEPRRDRALTPREDPRRESGQPGGGQGRVDETGKSGVYPASGPRPPEGTPVEWAGSFGQGERGAEGYEDSGDSNIEAVQDVLRQQREAEERERDQAKGEKQQSEQK